MVFQGPNEAKSEMMMKCPVKKGILHLDPAWASFALSSCNIFIEILFKGVVFKLFFTSLVLSSVLQDCVLLTCALLICVLFVLRALVTASFCPALSWRRAYVGALLSCALVSLHGLITLCKNPTIDSSIVTRKVFCYCFRMSMIQPLRTLTRYKKYSTLR